MGVLEDRNIITGELLKKSINSQMRMRNSKLTAGIFSMTDDNWETPQYLFDELNSEFKFTLDPCCTAENAKCSLFFTKEKDGLAQNWQGHTVFCNPPYGRAISAWVEKCYLESRKPNTKVVMLIPARTDTSYFHDFIYHNAELRFIRGRLRFVGARHGAPFPSMIVIFN